MSNNQNEEQQQAMETLNEQLQQLHEQEVSELMQEGRSKELLNIIRNNEDYFFAIDSYIKKGGEIPIIKEEYIYELIFYIFNTGWQLKEFLSEEAYDMLIEFLKNRKERLSEHLLKTIEENYDLLPQDSFRYIYNDNENEESIKELIGA